MSEDDGGGPDRDVTAGALSEVDEYFVRHTFDLPADAAVDRRAILEALAGSFADLRDAGFEARPHVRFPLERAAFADALDRVLDGETVHLDDPDRLVVVEDDLEFGRIPLSVTVRQYVESSLSGEGDGESDPADVGDDALIDRHYPDGAVHLQRTTRRYPVERYTTLLRDVSRACREAVETMHDVVDDHPDLVWGEEPKLDDTHGAYEFSGVIYYRPAG